MTEELERPNDEPEVEAEDDLRFAPPMDAIVSAEEDENAAEASGEPEENAAEAPTELGENAPSDTGDEETAAPFESAEEQQTTSAEPAESLDVDAALAAVSNLGEFVDEQARRSELRKRQREEQARRAAEEAQRQAELEAQAAAAEAQALAEAQAETDAQAAYVPEIINFPMPPMVTLRRGSMASVIPGLLLIAVGAWLTFALTTSDTPPSSGLVVGVLAGAVFVTLLVQWLSSARWSTGTLLLALTLLISAGVTYFLTQTDNFAANEGWPLYVGGVGIAFILAGLLGHPRNRGALFPGLLLVVATVIAMLFTTGRISTDITDNAKPLWPAVIVIFVILWLLPVVFRRRT